MKFTMETFMVFIMLALATLVTAAGQVCPKTQACTALSVVFDKHVIHHTDLTEIGDGLCSADRNSFGTYLEACASQVESSMNMEHGIITTPVRDMFDQYCNTGSQHYDLVRFVESGQTLTNEFGLSITLPNGTLVESTTWVDPPIGTLQQGNTDARGCFCDGGRCSKLKSVWSSCAPHGASDTEIGHCVCGSNTMLYYLHECFTCAIELPPQGISSNNYSTDMAQGTFAMGNILSSYSGVCKEYWSGTSNIFNIAEWFYGLSFFSDSFGVVFPSGTRYDEPSKIVQRAIGFNSSSALQSTSTTTSFTTVTSFTLPPTLTTSKTVSLSSSVTANSSLASSVSSSTAQPTTSGPSVLTTSSTAFNTSTSLSSYGLPVLSSAVPVRYSTSTSTDVSITSTSTIFNTHTATVILTIFDSTSSSASSVASDASMGLVTGLTVSSNDAISGSSSVPSTVTRTLKTTTTIHVSRISGSTCPGLSTTTVTVYGNATPMNKHVPSGTTSTELNDALTALSASSTHATGGLQGYQLSTGLPLMTGTITTSARSNSSYTTPANPPAPLQSGNGIQLGSSMMAAAVLIILLPLII